MKEFHNFGEHVNETNFSINDSERESTNLMNQGKNIASERKEKTHSSHHGHFHSDKSHRAWIAYIPDIPDPEKVVQIKKLIEKRLDDNLSANKRKEPGYFLKKYKTDKYNKVYYLDDTAKLLDSI